MHLRLRSLSRTLASVAIVTLAGAVAIAAPVQVTLDHATRYQTVLGWGAATPHLSLTPELRQDLLREAVDELGLTRLRLEPPSGNGAETRRYECINDDGDPEHINWAAFNTDQLDKKVTEWVLPFKQRVEAFGAPFSIYLSPSFFDNGSSGAAPGFLRYSPGEYADYALAYLLRLKHHGIEPDLYCILNEAGNNNPFTAALVADAIRALGPRMRAAGLATKIQFPECINGKTTWSYIQATQNDPDIWPYIGVISYHLYGDNSQRSLIRDFAAARGLPTAQTEYMGLTINHLHDDFTLGGVSHWEIYGIVGVGNACFDTSVDGVSFKRGSKYWTFRQAMRYIRPGAVRIAASSSDSGVRALAFERGGRTVALVSTSGSAQSVVIGPLPPGDYAASRSINSAAAQELGVQTLATTATLTFDMPANTVLTVYPHPAGNLPPSFTLQQSTPAFLTQPASTATLGAAATDPELNPISFTWSIVNQPAGANARLGAPHAAYCQVSGLSLTGLYTFRVAASDGASTVTREVRLPVNAVNQPPLLFDVHNRLPVRVTLPQTSTELRAAVQDLEGDAASVRWSILSQPAGADAQLTSPTQTRCLLTQLTASGDYVLRFEATAATNASATSLTVHVYPANTAPRITAASAAPASVKLPTHTTALSATTIDTDGDTLTHWWTVKSAPVGARPFFQHQGWAATTVDGLSVPGDYTFTLTVIDELTPTSRDVTVHVDPADNAISSRSWINY